MGAVPGYDAYNFVRRPRFPEEMEAKLGKICGTKPKDIRVAVQKNKEKHEDCCIFVEFAKNCQPVDDQKILQTKSKKGKKKKKQAFKVIVSEKDRWPKLNGFSLKSPDLEVFGESDDLPLSAKLVELFRGRQGQMLLEIETTPDAEDDNENKIAKEEREHVVLRDYYYEIRLESAESTVLFDWKSWDIHTTDCGKAYLESAQRGYQTKLSNFRHFPLVSTTNLPEPVWTKVEKLLSNKTKLSEKDRKNYHQQDFGLAPPVPHNALALFTSVRQVERKSQKLKPLRVLDGLTVISDGDITGPCLSLLFSNHNHSLHVSLDENKELVRVQLGNMCKEEAGHNTALPFSGSIPRKVVDAINLLRTDISDAFARSMVPREDGWANAEEDDEQFRPSSVSIRVAAETRKKLDKLFSLCKDSSEGSAPAQEPKKTVQLFSHSESSEDFKYLKPLASPSAAPEVDMTVKKEKFDLSKVESLSLGTAQANGSNNADAQSSVEVKTLGSYTQILDNEYEQHVCVPAWPRQILKEARPGTHDLEKSLSISLTGRLKECQHRDGSFPLNEDVAGILSGPVDFKRLLYCLLEYPAENKPKFGEYEFRFFATCSVLRTLDLYAKSRTANMEAAKKEFRVFNLEGYLSDLKKCAGIYDKGAEFCCEVLGLKKNENTKAKNDMNLDRFKVALRKHDLLSLLFDPDLGVLGLDLGNNGLAHILRTKNCMDLLLSLLGVKGAPDVGCLFDCEKTLPAEMVSESSSDIASGIIAQRLKGRVNPASASHAMQCFLGTIDLIFDSKPPLRKIARFARGVVDVHDPVAKEMAPDYSSKWSKFRLWNTLFNVARCQFFCARHFLDKSLIGSLFSPYKVDAKIKIYVDGANRIFVGQNFDDGSDFSSFQNTRQGFDFEAQMISNEGEGESRILTELKVGNGLSVVYAVAADYLLASQTDVYMPTATSLGNLNKSKTIDLKGEQPGTRSTKLSIYRWNQNGQKRELQGSHCGEMKKTQTLGWSEPKSNTKPEDHLKLAKCQHKKVQYWAQAYLGSCPEILVGFAEDTPEDHPKRFGARDPSHARITRTQTFRTSGEDLVKAEIKEKALGGLKQMLTFLKDSLSKGTWILNIKKEASELALNDNDEPFLKTYPLHLRLRRRLNEKVADFVSDIFASA